MSEQLMKSRLGWSMVAVLAVAGCTVKAVGDPNRPITINAHVTIDVQGLQQTASGIEDYVSGSKPVPSATKVKGDK